MSWMKDLQDSMKIRAITLSSGGINSAVTQAIANTECHEVVSWTFRCKNDRATSSAKMLSDYFDNEHHVIDIGMKPSYGMMLLGALQKRGFHRVYIGLSTVDPVSPEKTEFFIRKVQEVYDFLSGGNVVIVTPVSHMTKREVVLEGERLQVPWELTYSCEEDNGPCKECKSCKEREGTFISAGVKDR